MALRRSDEPIQGKRVTLRLWQPHEAQWYVDARDDAIFRFTRESPGLSVDLAEHNIRECLADPECIGYAITDKATGELAGNIALSLVDVEDESEVEVMYWVSARFRERGFAADAVSTLIDWAFGTLPIRRIQLLTDPGNEASEHVALRCGFHPHGESDGRLLFVRSRVAT